MSVEALPDLTAEEFWDRVNEITGNRSCVVTWHSDGYTLSVRYGPTVAAKTKRGLVAKLAHEVQGQRGFAE